MYKNIQPFPKWLENILWIKSIIKRSLHYHIFFDTREFNLVNYDVFCFVFYVLSFFTMYCMLIMLKLFAEIYFIRFSKLLLGCLHFKTQYVTSGNKYLLSRSNEHRIRIRYYHKKMLYSTAASIYLNPRINIISTY